MRSARSRRWVRAALLATLMATLMPSAAQADGDLVATPTTIKDSAPIAVRWTPRAAPDAALYTYRLDVTSSNAKGCSNAFWQAVPATWKQGQTLRFTVRPSGGGRSWCPGGAGVLIRVVSVPRTPGEGETKLASAYVAVEDDPATPPNVPSPFQPMGTVRLRISPGTNIGLASTVTVAWRTDVTLGRDEGYQVVLQSRAPKPVAPTCVAALPRIVGRGSPRGRLIRVRMNPNLRQGVSGWCPADAADLVVQRVSLDAKGNADPQIQQSIRFVATVYGLTFRR